MIEQEIKKSFTGIENGVFSFFIKDDFEAFKGHFPSNPILPGIVQIDMALFCIRRALNDANANIKGIKKVKFIKPIEPESKLLIELKQDEYKFNVIIKNDRGTFSQMSLIVR
jgi:3-hydroxymyristoyl/3-hydroxydecanoyl-(acyl carrier protein) dehydratase